MEVLKVLMAALVISAGVGCATTPTDTNKSETGNKNQTVKWIGKISDPAATHTTNHNHDPDFIRQGTNEKYDIVDSPELLKFHHESERNHLLEIEGELTPRFLFWGNNLIVKKFTVLEELDAAPHLKPQPAPKRIGRER